MFEPPIADFDTACTQMHEHDPATCAPENYDADRTANDATVLLEQEADEQTVRDALAYAIGGSIGALVRAAIAEQPGADLHRDMDRALAAVAEAASRQAIAEAGR